MSKWLERARARKECLPPVPNVPIVPKVVAARSFGTIGSFGTGGKIETGHRLISFPSLQKVSPIEIDEAEREAIAIELGGIPTIYASEFARLQAHPPAEVPHDRWGQFINDAGLFFDRWGKPAEALGWRADELFGLDPCAPLARYDRMGLIWMVKSERVVDLTATGGRLSGGLMFYRKWQSNLRLLSPQAAERVHMRTAKANRRARP
jgi:hypothetical protein